MIFYLPIFITNTMLEALIAFFVLPQTSMILCINVFFMLITVLKLPSLNLLLAFVTIHTVQKLFSMKHPAVRSDSSGFF